MFTDTPKLRTLCQTEEKTDERQHVPPDTTQQRGTPLNMVNTERRLQQTENRTRTDHRHEEHRQTPESVNTVT